MSVLIIAEAGVNHNGSIDIAKQLIDVASNSGADVVKFQTFNANRQVTRTAKKADYQDQTSDKRESQYAMLRRLELNEAMHHELIDHCAKRNIGFLSTGFDIKSIDLLVNLGQKCFKIPSGEITNFPLLVEIGKMKKKIILSTGMSNISEIKKALKILIENGTKRDDISILHCITAYPTPLKEVNLGAINNLKKKFNIFKRESSVPPNDEVIIHNIKNAELQTSICNK